MSNLTIAAVSVFAVMTVITFLMFAIPDQNNTNKV